MFLFLLPLVSCSAEGMVGDREIWRFIFIWMKEHGLTGVRLIIGDKNLSIFETILEVFTDAICSTQSIHRRARKRSVKKQSK